MKKIIAIILLPVLFYGCKVKEITSTTENKTEISPELISIINTELITKHITTLASDEMEGRKSGTEGIEKAAQYIEGEFERIGLTSYSNLPKFRQNFRTKGLDLFNVIGVLEGNSRKDEYVVVSGHYDHLGVIKNGEGDNIYNGADDDASGISAVLALAEYFKKTGKNERTIIFIAFTGEEMGLLGSNYFGKGIDASKFIAGINIEMIGKESKFGPKTAWLTGFKRSTFGTIVQKNLEGSGYKLYPDPYKRLQLFYRSDNASLAELGIPAHTFSTGPIDTDEHYHKVSDEVSTLNMVTITETVRAIAIGTQSIIDGTDTPSRVTLK